MSNNDQPFTIESVGTAQLEAARRRHVEKVNKAVDEMENGATWAIQEAAIKTWKDSRGIVRLIDAELRRRKAAEVTQ